MHLRPRRGEGWFEGGCAAGVALLSLVVARIAFDGPSPSEVVADALIGIVPGALFSLILGQLEFAAKPLLHVGIGIGAIGVGAIVGRMYVACEASLVRLIGTIAVLIAVLWLAVLPMLGAGLLGLTRPASPPLWFSTGFGAVVLVVLVHSLTQRRADVRPDVVAPGRRRLVLTIGAVASMVASWLLWRTLGQSQSASPVLGAATAADGDGHPTPEYTPVGVFYNVSKNMLDPRVDEDGWRLRIIGDVENEYELTFAELKALPSVEQPATLCCISNEVGGDLVGHAQWKGVRLRDLLERGGVKPDSIDVVFHCRDEYRDSIALADALRPETIVVYEMNGAPLTHKHGFPIRVIVPGIYGMKNAKWVDRIQVVDNDFKGFWQVQGWSDTAGHQTMSRIDRPHAPRDRAQPGPRPIHGIAFGGDRGIARVEVSVDGGGTWFDAALRPAAGPFSWVRWSASFTPEVDERRTLMVRATDGSGRPQIDRYATPFPNGSTGYHSIAVTFENG
ncbi:MAG: molybdopterin-binding oxidoreductase [Chloroflexota bacterium]|nr:MAG: molybdopterin-binding oxidoreductase [Chloroflexota bacterium]